MRAMTSLSSFFLLSCLFATTSIAAPADDWKQLAWPEHRPRITDALQVAESKLQAADQDNEAIRIAAPLIAAARKPWSIGCIEGDWQVRSVQVNGNVGFAYPFFRARIERDGDGWRFAKTSGSQRRSGWLLPINDDARALAFLGASTVNDDPLRRYSRSDDPDARAPGEFDSAGRLLRLSADELLLILDADAGRRRYEIYHLKR